MNTDVEYLKNYTPDHLYVIPAEKGAYATLVCENEEVIGEFEVGERFRIAVSGFYVSDRSDFGTIKLTKLKFHKTRGWQEDGVIQVNNFGVDHIRAFLAILSTIKIPDGQKAKINLKDVNLEAFASILDSPDASRLLKEISSSPNLHEDIYALASKRNAIEKYRELLSLDTSEPTWQEFFEENSWIFGHGLNYISLEKVSTKLEAATTGQTFETAGKRADGLMRTRAEVSQYVLVEIKRADTPLLKKSPYRPGCWTVSSDVSDAVGQAQKTVLIFQKVGFEIKRRTPWARTKALIHIQSTLGVFWSLADWTPYWATTIKSPALNFTDETFDLQKLLHLTNCCSARNLWSTILASRIIR